MNSIRGFDSILRDNSEHRALYQFIQAVRMPPSYRRRLDGVVSRNDRRLTVANFREAFPSFPVTIVVRPSQKTKEFTGLNQFFGMAKGRKLLAEFAEAIEENSHWAKDRVTALLIKIPNVIDWAVVHNGQLPTFDDGVYFVVRAGGSDIVVESMVTFVAARMAVFEAYYFELDLGV